MLRFTKGCKDTNVAGRYFLLPRHLLELRFLAKLQKIPRKAAISHLHVWVCVRCREDLFYRLFASFQGRSRQSALDVTMAEHDHRGYIVDATRSMHGKAVSPFLIKNRLAVSNLWPRADGHGRFGS